MIDDEFLKSKRQVIKDKFALIKYCKKKLNDKGIRYIDGKPFSMCKHKVIIAKYNEVLNSIALEDYQEYLRIKKDKENAYVYVIGNKEMNICKIGFTNNIFKRIIAIQTGCPFKLEIFCVVEGSVQTEKKLHEKYKDLRMNGEWFRYEGKLKESVENTESVIKDLFLSTKNPKRKRNNQK